MKVLLGIDVGTSGVKAVTTDLEGRRIAASASRYATETQGQAAEQDPADWWNAVVDIVPAVVGRDEVAAVAVTSQAPTLVPVDSNGAPTGPALTWLDRRAAVEGRKIAELVPDSRNGADPFFGTAKLPWLASHCPGALAAAAHVVSANGFIVHRLTGEFTLDDSTASLMQGFDDDKNAFAEALLQSEPSIAMLPEVQPANAVVGRVTPKAATETGITAGAPVVAGAIDSVGSALEAGALQPGDPLVDMTGFSSVTILPVPRGTRLPGFIHARHCLPDVDLLITAQVTAGAAVDWVNGLFPNRDLRDDANLARRQRPGRLTMVPSLAGERTPTWNAHARGVLSGVDLTTDGVDLMLAAMEGNALALAQDVETLKRHGFVIDKVLSTGGGASSATWLQIKADVLGCQVVKPRSGHGAAQGAAVLAGLGIGIYSSLEQVRHLTNSIEHTFFPDPAKTAAYSSSQEIYADLSEINRL